MKYRTFVKNIATYSEFLGQTARNTLVFFTQEIIARLSTDEPQRKSIATITKLA